VIVYAETSAVLAWLLGESRGRRVARTFRSAERIVASGLTVAECERALVRAVTTGQLDDEHARRIRQLLGRAVKTWALVGIGDAVLARTSQRFPVEPVRTLDAIHLATARLVADQIGPILVVSLDERVRANAPGLGLDVGPRQDRA